MPYALDSDDEASHPYEELAALIRADPDYAWAWHCVAACAAMDEKVDHDTANRIASRMMRMMFNAHTQNPSCSRAEGGYHDPVRLTQLPQWTLWDHLRNT